MNFNVFIFRRNATLALALFACVFRLAAEDAKPAPRVYRDHVEPNWRRYCRTQGFKSSIAK